MEIKRISILTKKQVIVIMTIITAALTIISFLVISLWLGLILSLIINYFIFKELYPNISIDQVEKIIGHNVVETKKRGIACSTYFLKTIVQKNRVLKNRGENYRWFLTTCPKFIDSHKELSNGQKTKIIKINKSNCFFFIKECQPKNSVKKNDKNYHLNRIYHVTEEEMREPESAIF